LLPWSTGEATKAARVSVRAHGDVVEGIGILSSDLIDPDVEESESRVALLESDVVQQRNNSGEGWSGARGSFEMNGVLSFEHGLDS